jgi:hypothetical protein
MAGYSGTPLPKKLGLQPGSRLGLVRPPADFGRSLGDLPDGVSVRDGTRAKGPFDVLVLFVRSAGELRQDLPVMKDKLDKAGGLWIGWPKKAPTGKGTPIVTDLGETAVRELGLAAGLVDNKVCALDDTWSGLRFVYRLADRGKPGRATRT